MPNMLRKILAVVNCLFIVVFLLTFFLKEEKQPFYIDNKKLFQEFEMTKAYQKRIHNSESKYAKLLDSLKLDFTNRYEDGIKTKEASNEYQKIKLKEEGIIASLSKLRSTYDNEIWLQLNQYVNDYGKKFDLSLILGAAGNGSLMYASEERDLTESVIEFVNTKYNGFE